MRYWAVRGYKTLVGMSEVKEPLAGPDCKLEDYLKMELI
jgi:hypothetical protein